MCDDCKDYHGFSIWIIGDFGPSSSSHLYSNFSLFFFVDLVSYLIFNKKAVFLLSMIQNAQIVDCKA